MRTFKVSVGNDPEVFIKVANRVIPSETILHKKEALIKVDNAAIELQPGPRQCLQEQNKEIAFALDKVRNAIKPTVGARISLRPVESLRKEDLRRYRSVAMFGCQPSLVFDGNSLDISVPDADPLEVRYRSVGYHVHLGSDTPESLKELRVRGTMMNVAKVLHSTAGRVRLVQVCDLIVGLPAVLLERDERVVLRRNILGYGKAGEFREQPHGFEYRTLGSWPLFHPMWGWWANAAVRDALHIVIADQDQTLKEGIDLVAVAKAINSNDLHSALVLWHQVKKNLVSIVKDWEKDNSADSLDESHPILSRHLLRYFDFLVMKKDLHRRIFGFNHWCRRVVREGWEGRKPVAFFTGFPRGAIERIADQNMMDFVGFTKNWSLDKDIISKHLV